MKRTSGGMVEIFSDGVMLVLDLFLAAVGGYWCILFFTRTRDEDEEIAMVAKRSQGEESWLF